MRESYLRLVMAQKDPNFGPAVATPKIDGMDRRILLYAMILKTTAMRRCIEIGFYIQA